MPFQSTVGDYQTVATLETFGFLPPMTQDEIYDQIAYIIAQGWSPLVEHVHPSNSMATYWSYWKLPFFGEKDLNVVVSELEACHRAYPDHHVRIVGYDAYTQSQGACFVVFEGRRSFEPLVPSPDLIRAPAFSGGASALPLHDDILGRTWQDSPVANSHLNAARR